jgi:hypothetical protein
MERAGSATVVASEHQHAIGARRTGSGARLAGTVGVIANVILLGYFATYAAGSAAAGARSLLGPASDLTGSLFGALLIPVAVAVGRELPQTIAVRAREILGIVAMAALAAGGVLLRVGLASFEVATALSIIGTLGVAAWVALTARGLGSTATVSMRTSRLGQVLGGGELAGVAVAAAGLAFPSGSAAQIAVLAVGLVPAFICWFAVPVWVLLLAEDVRHTNRSGGRKGTEAR